MKVCHFVASTGLGRGDVFVDLANAQSEQDEVCIVAPKGANFKNSLVAKVELLEYSSRNTRLNPLLLIELYRLFKKINPDIVHAHFAKATEIFNLIGTWLKIPWVATKHNPRKGRIYNNVEHVIAVSEGVAKSVEHDSVKIIHNGIRLEKFPAIEKEDVFTILAVGRLETVKAFDQLIEECAKLSFDFRLKIVGDGPQKESLVELAKSTGIYDKVEFLGFRKDVPALMRASDVVVVCSRSEGFSLVILEGLFYGNVLISRDVGIATALLEDKFIIKDYAISSRLEAVFADYDTYAKDFRALREQRGSDYLLENSVRQHSEYYKEVLLKSLK